MASMAWLNSTVPGAVHDTRMLNVATDAILSIGLG